MGLWEWKKNNGKKTTNQSKEKKKTRRTKFFAVQILAQPYINSTNTTERQRTVVRFSYA